MQKWLLALGFVVLVLWAGQVLTGGSHAGLVDDGPTACHFVTPADKCPLLVKPRSDAVCEPFATSNGNLDWLVSHPSYYQEYYHGYYPWSTDDYSRFTPFDLNSPYFFLN